MSTELWNLPVGLDRSRTDTATQAVPVSTLVYATYLVYTVFFFLNIPSRYPQIGVVRPTVLLAALILVMLLVQKKGARKDISGTTKILIAFIGYCFISLPFVQWPGSVLRVHLEDFFKVAVFFFFTVQVVDTPQRLKRFVALVVGLQVVRVLEPLKLHITDGYWGSNTYVANGEFMRRLSGAPSDIVNSNGLAFLVITALPFLYYLCFRSRSRALQGLFFAAVVPMLWAMTLTASRSGMVGLAVLLLAIAWNSRHKVTLIAVAVMGVLVVTPMLSPDMRDRYFSLVSSDAESSGTVQARIDGLWANLYEGLQRPIFGHGLGTSREAAYNYNRGTHVAHNLYLEAFIETGVIGLGIYCAFLLSILKNYRRAMAAAGRLVARREDPWADYYLRLADAIRAFAVMCLVFSIAQYGVREFHWYLIGGLSVVLARLATEHAERAAGDPDRAPPPDETAGAPA